MRPGARGHAGLVVAATVTALPAGDVVCGGDGSDEIVGGAGDDRLFGELDGISEGTSPGGATYDIVEGDWIRSGSGDDLVDLGYDARQLTAVSWEVDRLQLDGTRGTRFRMAPAGETGIAVGHGRDRIRGQEILRVLGSPGPDRVWGTPDGDSIEGGAGDDVLRGLGGRDSLRDSGGTGSRGSDVLLGGPGNDGLSSDGGHDVVDGQGGRDSVSSGSGATVRGGGGNDFLFFGRAGAGCVRQLGGEGRDRLALRPSRSARNDVITVGLDHGPLGACGEVGTVEHLFLDYGFADETGPTWRVTGTSGPDRVEVFNAGRVVGHLRAGDDRFLGGWRNDVVRGGSGEDHANGRDGRDRCLGFEAVFNCEVE